MRITSEQEHRNSLTIPETQKYSSAVFNLFCGGYKQEVKQTDKCSNRYNKNPIYIVKHPQIETEIVQKYVCKEL